MGHPLSQRLIYNALKRRTFNIEEKEIEFKKQTSVIQEKSSKLIVLESFKGKRTLSEILEKMILEEEKK